MTYVVIGAGLAGGTAVTQLRELGVQDPIVLYGSERHPPYERPPLSKSYLLGDDPFEKALVHDESWYADHDVDLRLGTEVVRIDLAGETVETADGLQAFDRLLLTMGSQPRQLPMADESGVPVAYLRRIEDSDRIRESFGEGRRIVLIGGGWIGLEVAAAARAGGTEVVVLEAAELPLLGVLGPQVATVFADLHREHGVDLRLGAHATAEDLQGADLVVVGIGARPSTDLAEAAGLDVDDGVLVGPILRTSHPMVFAAGDVANQLHPTLGRLRVEHWDNAIEQAKVAAANLSGDQGLVYDRLPYFFTDQYDLGMEYVGHGSAKDSVELRGDVPGRVFRAIWRNDEGVVTAAMHVNDWDAMDELRALVGHRG